MAAVFIDLTKDLLHLHLQVYDGMTLTDFVRANWRLGLIKAFPTVASVPLMPWTVSPYAAARLC